LQEERRKQKLEAAIAKGTEMSYTSILEDEKREKAANYEIWRNEQKQIKKDEAAELKRQRDEKLNERMKSGKI